MFPATHRAEIAGKPRGAMADRMVSSSSLPEAGEPGEPHAVADLRQGLQGGGLVKMRECGVELRPERERVKQLANPADRLGLAVCLFGVVNDLERPGKAVMDAPVVGKVDKCGSQRGDCLIGVVVVLEVPPAAPSPETTVTLIDRPGFQ